MVASHSGIAEGTSPCFAPFVLIYSFWLQGGRARKCLLVLIPNTAFKKFKQK